MMNDKFMDTFNDLKKQLENFNLKQLHETALKYSVKDVNKKKKDELINAILHQMYILMHQPIN